MPRCSGPPGSRRAFSVAALDMDGKHRQSSNRGLNVVVSAPGESIYSLSAKEGKRDGRIMPILAGSYHRLGGTSFAAPFVSGTAALLWTKTPDLTNAQVEDLMLASAKDIHTAGWDAYTGAGSLNAYGALTMDPDSLLAPRITELQVHRDKRRIVSMDVYGAVRGALDSYRVEIGRGEDPDNWEQVFGPSKDPAEFGLICRIGAEYFERGSKRSLRLVALDRMQQTKSTQVLVTRSKPSSGC